MFLIAVDCPWHVAAATVRHAVLEEELTLFGPKVDGEATNEEWHSGYGREESSQEVDRRMRFCGVTASEKERPRAATSCSTI